MKDELTLAALAIGGLWLMGSLKKDGKTVAEDISENIAKGAAAGAAGAVKGAAVGAVVGVASVVPGANPSTGVGQWTVPIPGGAISGTPLQVIGSGGFSLDNLIVGWNLLPFLPDYTGGDIIPGLHLW